jgi:hypothetical protein
MYINIFHIKKCIAEQKKKNATKKIENWINIIQIYSKNICEIKYFTFFQMILICLWQKFSPSEFGHNK